ncbi:hypothetical protein [Niastella sp. OAS944]|uniref:hypothetical protein n=1 Tax=Niastella sp. OAS944 TaxID=2664089 RepID=UPI00347E5C62|nr:hypothetical protein [Chitinophagaceae bacterium OAS944]
MTKYIYSLLFMIGSFSNCTGKKQGKVNKNDQISSLDSIKWFMYALNNYGKIQAKDSFSRNVEMPVVSFDIKLSSQYNSNDTVAYGFEFVKAGYHSVWVDKTIPVMGIGLYGGNKYFLDFPHISPDFAGHPDSIRLYMEGADKSFRNYLQTYKGDIAPWLKEQIEKRQIKR